MGKINVVLADGKTISVDEEQYRAAQKAAPTEGSGAIRAEGVSDSLARFDAEAEERLYSGARGALEAGGAAFADSATLGIAGKVVGAISDEAGETWQKSQKHHEGASTVGALAGLVTGAGAVGTAAKAGKALAGKTGSKAAGYILEGGVLSAGGHVAGTTVTGDPLSIEGLAESFGVGGLLNAGISKVADRLMGAAGKAGVLEENPLAFDKVTTKGKTPLADAARARVGLDAAKEAEQVARAARQATAADKAAAREATALHGEAMAAHKESVEGLKQAKQVVDESPAYASMRDAHEVRRAQVAAENTAYNNEVKEYAKYTSPKGVQDIVKGYEAAENTIRARMAKAAAGGTAQAEADAVILTQLQDAMVSISKMKNTLKSAAKDDQYEIALSVIGDVEKKVASLVPDVPLPKTPVLPSERGLQEVVPSLPKTLSGLGGVQKDTVAKLAGAVDDMTRAELDKLAVELGLDVGETAGDTLSEIHKYMRKTFYGPKLKKPVAPGKAVDEVEDVIKSLDDEAKLEATTEAAKWKAAEAEVDAARAAGKVEEATVDDVWEYVGLPGGAKKARFGKEGSWADGPIDAVKGGLVRGAGRAFDSGGWKGAVMRSLAGGTAGYALDGASGALYGGALMNGKVGMTGKIRAIFGNFAVPAANIIKRIGPVTAGAAYRFPSGEEDDSTDDHRQQVVNRINDVNMAAMSAPDAMYDLVKPMLGMPNDIAGKVHDKVSQSLEYLKALAPRDPGIDKSLGGGSNYLPTWSEADEYMHRYEATMSPTTYLVRTLNGDGHPSGVEALAVNWPAFLQTAMEEATARDWNELQLEQHRGLSMLFGTDLSGLQHPDVIAIIQGQFLPRDQPQEQGPGQEGGQQASRATGKPNGRPAAVQSPVAGANPGALTA